MPVEQWNESGRVWEEDHGLLDEEQVARCARAAGSYSSSGLTSKNRP